MAPPPSGINKRKAGDNYSSSSKRHQPLAAPIVLSNIESESDAMEEEPYSEQKESFPHVRLSTKR